MNKEEVVKLAKEHGATELEPFSTTAKCDNSPAYLFTQQELLAFANDCEKIGMEKAIGEHQEKNLPVFRLLGDGLRIDMNYLCIGEKRGITQHISWQNMIQAVNADLLVENTCSQMYKDLWRCT